ncbi:hypothetical protein [Geosporobacter ferrireducens]|uniref:Uncharacterized protein n=1 Tax=Geosporobacter ferrireducens TaxID=1424294 RepID=A0A1D8GH04_9FIRM|nr:hypothetical protein [Geosporobacter ferrireducens]AOT70184.1 hypothetical protein Gferi_11615 [Geosporobacter ferrireducens]MTI53269.1 hypothetical protein [Geosporobacter ferrireducens]
MNKRIILSILLIGVLMFGAGMGTIAYYAQMFTSEANEVVAAAWEVSPGGILQEEFTADSVKLAPGEENNYEFSIDKAGTEVPVEYLVKVLTADGESEAGVTGTPSSLFSTGTPIQFRVTMNGEEGPTKRLTLNGDAVKFPVTNKGKDEFVLNVKWPWGSGIAEGETRSADVEFAGLSGNFVLKVEAKQGKIAVPPVTPEPLTAKAKLEVDKLIGSDITSSNSNVEVELLASETEKELIIKNHPQFGNLGFRVSKNGDKFAFNNALLYYAEGGVSPYNYLEDKTNTYGWRITTPSDFSFVSIEITNEFGALLAKVWIDLDLTNLSDPSAVHNWFRP